MKDRHLAWEVKEGTMESILIYLDSDDVLGVSRNIQCNVDPCQRTFATVAALLIHWQRIHFPRQDGFIYTFYCPEIGCLYHKDGYKTFWNTKLLKQHFMSMHTEKLHICEKCNLKFSLERLLKAHMKNCGNMFKCDHCEAVYPARTALLTHCHRAKHALPQKLMLARSKDYGEKVTPSKELPKTVVINVLNVSNQVIGKLTDNSLNPKQRILLPKPTVTRTLQPYMPNTCTRDVQILPPAPTSDYYTSSSGDSQDKPCDNTSIGLQIGAPKLSSKVVAETQTSGEYIMKKAMQSASLLMGTSHKGSQVSPRAKERAGKRPRSGSTPYKSRKKKNAVTQFKSAQFDLASSNFGKRHQSSTSTSTCMMTDNPFANCQDLGQLASIDIETQTVNLVKDFEDCLATTMSTQTFNSFLSARNQTEHHSIETQTAIRPFVSGLQSGFNDTVGHNDAMNAKGFHAPIASENQVPESHNAMPRFENSNGTCSVIDEFLQSMGTQTMDFDNSDFLADTSMAVPQVNIETQTVDLLEEFLINMETQTTDGNLFPNAMFTNTEVQTNLCASVPSLVECGTTMDDLTQFVDLDASSASTQTRLRMSGQPNMQATNMETQTFLDDFAAIFDNTLTTHTQTNLF